MKGNPRGRERRHGGHDEGSGIKSFCSPASNRVSPKKKKNKRNLETKTLKGAQVYWERQNDCRSSTKLQKSLGCLVTRRIVPDRRKEGTSNIIIEASQLRGQREKVKGEA